MPGRAKGLRAEPSRSTGIGQSQSVYVSMGGELPLSNLGQLELLRAVLEKDVPFRVTMRGYSMAPCIRDGDIVTVTPVASCALGVGDVVAFSLPDSDLLAVHRIVAEAAEGWLIRGDACAAPDGLVGPGKILGKVATVERNGRNVRLGISLWAKGYAGLSQNDQLAVLRRVQSAAARARHLVARRLFGASRR